MTVLPGSMDSAINWCRVARDVSGMRARRIRPIPAPSHWAATAIRLLLWVSRPTAPPLSAAPSFPAGPHHGQSHLVKHAPRCVTAQAQIALQGQSTHATFLSRHEPHCSKPSFERKFRILKDRAPPTRGARALRAPISVGPPQRLKIRAAISLVFKLLFEFRLVSRINLRHANNTASCRTGVT